MAHQKIKYHGSPRRGTGFASHTKTLILGRAQNQLSPLPKIGEGFGKWSEAPSYEEGVGVDGGIAGFCLQWGLGGIPQWVKPTFLQLFQKKFCQVCHSQTTPFRIVVPL